MRHCLQLFMRSLENDWVARGSRGTASAERTGMREHVRPSVTRAEEVVANASGENFPVALRLLPARYRRHLTNLYFFARLTDDLGDEARRRFYCDNFCDLMGPHMPEAARVSSRSGEAAVSGWPAPLRGPRRTSSATDGGDRTGSGI